MASQGGPAERMGERRRLWQAFVETHGSKAYFANLAPPVADRSDQTQHAEIERLRSALLQPGAA
jgi:hypothetical protein